MRFEQELDYDISEIFATEGYNYIEGAIQRIKIKILSKIMQLLKSKEDQVHQSKIEAIRLESAFGDPDTDTVVVRYKVLYETVSLGVLSIIINQMENDFDMKFTVSSLFALDKGD